MAKRVILHVGAPKTGTSLVQDYMFANPGVLAARGILYPGDERDSHFVAALDLMKLPWGGLELQAAGAWDRIAEDVRGWRGTAVVSHEILARATPDMVARALNSFGGAEIHVLVSARDLVRQIPAEYQENVKHRRTLSYEEFLNEIGDPARNGPVASWFWDVQDIPGILDRWGSSLPAEQVHVLTVPPAGADRAILPDRFAEALSLNPAGLRAHRSRANPSLGAAETAFVRRVNEVVNPGNRIPGRFYREYVREKLVHQMLAERSQVSRIGLPVDVFEWARQVSASWADELGRRGYGIIGDLADLIVPEDACPTSDFPDPDHPDEAAVADVGLEAVVRLLDEVVELRRAHENLREEGSLVPKRSLVHRLKRRAVRAEKTNAVVRLAMGFLRRVRGH
jgi:hypothetical protein